MPRLTSPLGPKLRRLLAVAAVPVLIAAAGEAAAGDALTSREAAGRRIYHEGVGTVPLQATIAGGSVTVPASDAACVRCHGDRAGGRVEGGVRVPEIRWSQLRAAYAGPRPSGREHEPYREATFATALRDGVDPASQPLHPLMPRFRIADADIANLVAYLKRIDDEPTPGVLDDRLRVAMPIPSRGPLAHPARHALRLAQAMAREINLRGGLFGRRLDIEPLAYDPARPQDAAATLADGLAQGRIFCTIASIGLEPGDPIWRAALSTAAPLLAPATPVTVLPEGQAGAYTVLPSFASQARAMSDFVAERLAPRAARIALVMSARDDAALREQVARQIERRGGSLVAALAVADGAIDERAWRSLAASGADAIVMMAGGGAASELARRLASSDWKPLTIASAERIASALPAWIESPAVASRFFVATLFDAPVDDDPLLAHFARLIDEDPDAQRHLALLWSTFGAVELLTDTLRRSGRRLDRDRFIASLHEVQGLKIGLLPSLSFTATRASGAAGARIVAPDTDRRAWSVVRDWKEPL